MKICVYAIMKNESWCIKRFIEGAKDADMIYISDTGSTERELACCYAIASRWPTKVFISRVTVCPWRFDTARDAVLAQLPPDVDICVSLDLDEVLQPGWRAEIERVWKPTTTRLRYKFDWGCGIAFWYDKIHARKGYHWKNPVHEFPVPYGIVEEYAWTDENKLIVQHRPNGKGRPDYLPMLKMSVEEDPHEPRNAFYYARELSFYEHWEESIAECKRYLALPRADWKGERSYAYRTMGRCYVALGKPLDAQREFQLAADESPTSREPWCELAKLMYQQKRWSDSLGFAQKALAIKDREAVYTVDPAVWGHEPHTWASIAAWNLGRKTEALHYAREALVQSPDETLCKSNLKVIEENFVAV